MTTTEIQQTPAQPMASDGEPDQAPPSLRKSLVRGSKWTLIGFVIGNALRLGQSLVLTKLLSEEIYGQMFIPTVVMVGLQMFSDIGAGPAIVRDRRGDDPKFLNTAWTMQVVRGFVLWIVASLLAFPLSHVYKQPSLGWILPVVAIAAVIGGFNSTKLHTAHRHLAIRRLILLELTQHICAISVMIAVASFAKSPWALIAGGLTGPLVRMALSHAVLPGERNRFAFDRESYLALFHFGKWIFLGSAVYFLAQRGDGLLLGTYVSVAVLGVYGLALQWADALISLTTELSRNVLLPGLSRVHRERADDMTRVFYKARLRLDVLLLPGIGGLISAGWIFISVAFDARWSEAGWMLQLLCVKAATKVVVEPSEQCLVALGNTRIVFYGHLSRAVWVLGGIPLAWYQFGMPGLVAVAALSEVPVGALYWCGLRRRGILRPVLEARSAALLAAGFAAGLALDRVWPIVQGLIGR